MKCFTLGLFVVVFGFSLGDELGFKESLSNTDQLNRRRSADISKMQAQLIQATQNQLEQKKAKFVDPEKVSSSRSSSDSKRALQIISPVASGTVRHPSDSGPADIPPFKPIPPAAERPSMTKTPSLQPQSLGNSKHSSVDPSIAKVMAVVAVPKKQISQVDKSSSGFSNRLLTVDDKDVDAPVNQPSSNSLQYLLSANNLTEEALEMALLQRQNMLNKLKAKTTTTTSTTTRRPVTSKYANPNSIGKVMNAPKEYYPVGYDKNFDDNFAARVELPETSFYCEHQKHFPGLYADEDLGCMVFHVCALTDDGLIMKSFLCPESTLYDQAILKCNWWFYVDCKNSKKLYDSNIPISKSYQLMKALTFFSAYKKEPNSTNSKNNS
ncbi:uncharacterized protein LOC126748301 isoform X2 [Anthonomus grandis grandis]|uniref:uncharacterized protein LOC126748301 isoform X2 n=1 Tax=Anthonomus grandis grandis TaxID=2921223 RepID=UPI002165F211|nr:uncharacterized protein LOC126748301 isoform X2 [Anthonomus grandis grandis]